MIACPGCGFEAADDFAFCPKCATALVAPRAVPDERKVVTTLFCDLVGLTTLCERSDADEVDALLRRYNDGARTVIESHGVVEKFIGDAVVGVFGVPAVRADDPVRAVCAGAFGRAVKGGRGLGGVLARPGTGSSNRRPAKYCALRLHVHAPDPVGNNGTMGKEKPW